MFQIILVPTFILLVSIFPFLSHPLSIGVSLLIITVIISLIVGVFHSSLWVSYATVLILLGGLLVIFIYVALLASNEIFKKNKFILLPLSLSVLASGVLFIVNPSIIEAPLRANLNLFNVSNKNTLDWLSDFYSYELSNLTLFLIFYLLLTLLVVVYNTKNNHGTLRRAS